MTKIIGLSGAKGSGKTTIAKILEKEYGYKRISLAAPIRDMARALLRSLDFKNERIEELLNDPVFKETPIPELNGVTSRVILQTLGTEWGRSLSPNIWADIAFKKAQAYDVVVIDDIRFQNEADRCSWVVRVLNGHSTPTQEVDQHPSELQDLYVDVQFTNRLITDPATIAREIHVSLF